MLSPFGHATFSQFKGELVCLLESAVVHSAILLLAKNIIQWCCILASLKNVGLDQELRVEDSLRRQLRLVK